MEITKQEFNAEGTEALAEYGEMDFRYGFDVGVGVVTRVNGGGTGSSRFRYRTGAS